MVQHADLDHTGLTGVPASVASDTIWDAAGDLVQGTGANTAAKLTAGSVGQFLRSAGAAAANAWAYPPGYQYNYTAFTSPVSPTATTEATANTVVTASAGIALDGSTQICVAFFSEFVKPDQGAAGRNIRIYLYDDTGGGAASVGRMAAQTGPAAADSGQPLFAMWVGTPSNATHTFSIRAAVSAGTGLVNAGAGGSGNSMPGYIRVTKA